MRLASSSLKLILMNMKTIHLKYCLFFLLLCSCDSDPIVPNTPFTPINIDFNIIGSGKISLTDTSMDVLPGNYLITNQNDWTVLLSKINAANPDTTQSFDTNINFTESIVVAVFDENRSGGANKIFVTSIIENQTQINISVGLQTGGIMNVVQQVFQLVKMPITTKAITFQ